MIITSNIPVQFFWILHASFPVAMEIISQLEKMAAMSELFLLFPAAGNLVSAEVDTSCKNRQQKKTT